MQKENIAKSNGGKKVREVVRRASKEREKEYGVHTESPRKRGGESVEESGGAEGDKSRKEGN